MSEYEKVRDRWIGQEGHTPQCRICGGYAREPELCRCSVEGAILLDLIKELRAWSDSELLNPDTELHVNRMADRAEARLEELSDE